MRSPRPSGGSVRNAAAAAALLALALALVAVRCESIVPRHSWSREWGPMVPHQTFPMDCAECHYPSSWDEIKADFAFDHGAATGHPLEGAHAEAACLRCHNDRGPVKSYLARGCGGCHVDPHKAALGTTCAQCHNQRVWEPVGLVADHARTRFPLTGRHALLQCETCHQRATVGDYRGTPAECHFCHQRDVATAFPNHRINGWTRDCERCHTPADWTAPGFNHQAFPLAGGHAGVDCLSCHAGGRFRGTPRDCFQCHRADYLAAPGHVAENRSTSCVDCHTIQGWR